MILFYREIVTLERFDHLSVSIVSLQAERVTTDAVLVNRSEIENKIFILPFVIESISTFLDILQNK